MALVPSPRTTAAGLQDASEEEIKKFLESIPEDDRQKVLDAFKIVEKEAFERISNSYHISGGDGDWGEYSMNVLVKQDGTGTVKEQRVTFRDSPEEIELWHGNWTIRGDLLTFQGTELETTTSGAGGVFTNKTVGSKVFRFLTTSGGNLLEVSAKREPYEAPFRDGKKKYLLKPGGIMEE